MRIVHVIPSLDPADGGPPVVAERLGAAQAAAGAEVAILFGHRPGAAQRIAAALGEVPGAGRLRLIEIEGPPARGLTDRRAVAALEREIRAGLDVAHVHGIWRATLAGAAVACQRAGTRYVIAPHGMLDPWSMRQRGVRKRIAMALLWRRLLRGAAFIHALNQDEADLMPRGLGPTKIIPNGIFIEEFENLPSPGSFRREHPELGDDPYILFLGRLHYKKGLDLLAPAFARALQVVPQSRLVVAGP
ncbi:MAG: glycosyltransferase, partial [Phycisphaerales bacterium JB039]